MRSLGTALVLAVCGCTPTLSSIGHERGIRTNVEEQRRIESVVAHRREIIGTVRALFGVRVERGGTHESFRYAVNAERGGRLRIEVLPTTAGFAVGAVVVTPQSFTMLDVGRRVATIGTDGRAALARLLGISLTAQEVYWIITGVLPPEGELRIWHRADDRQGWFVEEGAGRVGAVLTSEGLPETVVFSDPFQERESVVARYEGWREVADGDRIVRVPERIRITLPEHEVEVSIVARAVDVNGPIDPKRFTLDIPPSYSVERAGGGPRS